MSAPSPRDPRAEGSPSPSRVSHGADLRVRMMLTATAAVVLLAGLALQLLDRTIAVDLVGSALYACLVGLVVAIAWPRLPSWVLAAVAFDASAAIELLQLTGIPSRFVDAVPPLRLVFGSSFDPLDLVGYAIGAVLLVVVLAAARRIVRRPTGSAGPADRAPAG
ncbi:DUF2809 domain-containing protein [Agromyces sp. NPDC058110]|uniref:ribosomal maturation YjgA family protein n=1 Tax=Agromyces sp. NPDC058110 TaxID=3346345 RepID=UPI0036DC679D